MNITLYMFLPRGGLIYLYIWIVGGRVMAKVNELMEGRNQGMVLALKIAKEQGDRGFRKRAPIS